MEDAQDELDELVDNNPAGCHFQLIWLYQVAAKWHIKQDNSARIHNFWMDPETFLLMCWH
jgi:hypothetical protein